MTEKRIVFKLNNSGNWGQFNEDLVEMQLQRGDQTAQLDTLLTPDLVEVVVLSADQVSALSRVLSELSRNAVSVIREMGREPWGIEGVIAYDAETNQGRVSVSHPIASGMSPLNLNFIRQVRPLVASPTKRGHGGITRIERGAIHDFLVEAGLEPSDLETRDVEDINPLRIVELPFKRK